MGSQVYVSGTPFDERKVHPLMQPSRGASWSHHAGYFRRLSLATVPAGGQQRTSRLNTAGSIRPGVPCLTQQRFFSATAWLALARHPSRQRTGQEQSCERPNEA
jgi:hypothetical protein